MRIKCGKRRKQEYGEGHDEKGIKGEGKGKTQTAIFYVVSPACLIVLLLGMIHQHI
jgi:hypothetical protein